MLGNVFEDGCLDLVRRLGTHRRAVKLGVREERRDGSTNFEWRLCLFNVLPKNNNQNQGGMSKESWL
jgi:hypothetical protein